MIQDARPKPIGAVFTDRIFPYHRWAIEQMARAQEIPPDDVIHQIVTQWFADHVDFVDDAGASMTQYRALYPTEG